MRRDRYENFEMLCLGEPPDAFRIRCNRRPSDVLIIAPHGGKIERWTSEIAAEISDDEYNLYCFEGRKRSQNRDLHITSSRFDEPQALEMLSGCNQVVAVHGCAGEEQVVYLGGLDHALRDAIAQSLAAHGIAVDVHQNPNFQGVHPKNICNRGRRGCGVQLELSFGLRSSLTEAAATEGMPTIAMFAAAIRDAIEATR